MGKTLYLECYSGISGDMTVGALLDLGAREEALREALEALPLKGYEIRIGRTKKCGIDACDFDVVLDKEYENHDHDMGYLHGHEYGEHSRKHEEAHACRANHHHETTGYVHEHENHDTHAHAAESHSHHGHHHHEHRGLNEIMAIIDLSLIHISEPTRHVP